MSNNPSIPQSKLPNLGTTIFTRMSALAQQHQAINLPQGFLDFDGPLFLQKRQAYHAAHGADQYTPVMGVQPLCEVAVDKTADLYDYKPDANGEVTIMAGATEVLHATITALVRPGNEVICPDSSYGSYVPAVELSGDAVKRIALQPPSFCTDRQAFGALLSDRTRSVILNTPHNSPATVRHHVDSDALWQAIKESEIFVISNEVYEHIYFAKQEHVGALAHSELWERVVVVSSLGKTHHMTGWRVGCCVVPAAIGAELRKVHQYLTFSVNTPAQLVLADMLRKDPVHYRELPAFYQKKHDVLVNALHDNRLEILSCEGTYFLLVDYSVVSSLNDVESCQWLTTEVGAAAIPLLAFCADPFLHRLIRLCSAKQESTLLVAAERLVSLQLPHSPDFRELTVSKQRLQAVDSFQA